jgi:hypothetical protein
MEGAMGTAPDRDYAKPRDAADFLAVAKDVGLALGAAALAAVPLYGITVAILSLGQS